MFEAVLFVAGLTVWSYWLGVLAMMGLAAARGRRSGAMPAEARERWMWAVWVPLVVAWNALPAVALKEDRWPWTLPGWATVSPWLGLRAAAAVVGVLSLLLTVRCWITMGRSWAMAVRPDEDVPLVTHGPYRWVRHPIYALSVTLMATTLIVLPTWPMLLVAAGHIALMHLKAANEERFLLARHGEAYRAYMRRTGRFLPRP